MGKSKIKVACVGDSITWGQGVFLHRGTQSYPALLQKELGRQYDVRNYGMPNHTMSDLSYFAYCKRGVYRKSLRSGPDVVAIMLGTNDSWQGWYPELYETQLSNLLRTYRALPSHPNVILMTPYYVSPEASPVNGDVVRNEVAPIVRKVGEKESVCVVDMFALTDGKTEYLCKDGVHPNPEGNAFLAEQIAEAIRGL